MTSKYSLGFINSLEVARVQGHRLLIRAEAPSHLLTITDWYYLCSVLMGIRATARLGDQLQAVGRDFLSKPTWLPPM